MEPTAVASTINPYPARSPTPQPVIDTNSIYSAICEQIIKEQFQIIGVLAFEQANSVEGLQVDPVTLHCLITGEGNKVVEEMINQYRDFFGNAAVEVCKEAASSFISRLPEGATPASLV